MILHIRQKIWKGQMFEISLPRTSILQISRKMIMETVFWNMLLEHWY